MGRREMATRLRNSCEQSTRDPGIDYSASVSPREDADVVRAIGLQLLKAKADLFGVAVGGDPGFHRDRRGSSVMDAVQGGGAAIGVGVGTSRTEERLDRHGRTDNCTIGAR